MTEAKRKATRHFYARYRYKRNAKNAARKACPIEPGLTRHHWSYNGEHYTDVIILPLIQHNKIHAWITLDEARKLYKTREGELLDSREKHEAYIEKLLKDL